MSNALKDKLLEVEMFVGDKLADNTNDQVLEKVRKEFGLQMYVNHAEELLYEFQQDINFERSQSW